MVAARARELLNQCPGAVAGLVLNTIDSESNDRGHYYYYGGYGGYRHKSVEDGEAEKPKTVGAASDERR